MQVDVVSAEVGETFLSCMQCGTCTSLCPWNQVSSFTPRGILRQLSLDSGTVQSVDRAVWQCVTCNACGLNCPRGIDIIDVIKAVRRFEISSDRIPEIFKPPLDSLSANGNPWEGLRANRLDWARDLVIPAFASEHEYCLFTCCTSAYDSSPTQSTSSAARALPQLLLSAGVSFGTLGTNESCCGDPADKIGADNIYASLVRKNTDLFLGAGVNKILATSPHCLNTFRHHYDKLKGVVVSEHYSELLDRLVAENRLKPTRNIARTVTYHDPCYLGRHNGIYEAPRRILRSIPGVTLIEMANNKQNSNCCGGGGGGAWNDGFGHQQLGVPRVQEALDIGAEVIATACPYCLRMLDTAIAELGVEDRIAVRDLAELLLASISRTHKTGTDKVVEVSADQEVCHV